MPPGSRSLGLYVTLLFVLPLAAGCPRSPLSDNVMRTSDIVYGMGYVRDDAADSGYRLQKLYFDLLEPTDIPATSRPAVLMIHGGSFMRGSKTDENLVAVANGLAEAGYVCFLINYRLDGDNPPHPGLWDPAPEEAKALDIPSLAAVRAAFVDAKTAMRHIRANSTVYGIDPARIAIWGESAGAFAALAAGLTEPEEFANDGEGFPVPPENNPGVNPRPAAIVECWGSAVFTPNAFEPGDPPIMIFHGLNDTTVPFIFALDIQARCQQAGIPYRMYLIRGGEHGCWDCEYDGKDLTTLTIEFLRDFMP